MLFYGCLYIGPLIQYLKTFQEIQPRCRITATKSQSHNEPSTNEPFLEAGQGGGWGCGPEQPAATVPCTSVYSECIAMARRTQHLAKAVCASVKYNESQTTASGSSTSTSI